ncbi:hypothetical protein ZIOFF_051076 [Zingiber officinale]|uniref:Protein kinase domain-containing protein n=2 Tax=Zingiber officinale TaxID=94328 RepID=A0A8J5KRQ1_ZINOF|nr:hypothetical protein ZIOFF_051076 [Zingiber officinale]
MAAISDVATAISLIGKVIKAATNAQLMKKEFKELVDYLELVGKQFEMLDDRELGDASMQTLQKMEEVLLQCHDLAISCQQRSSIYLVVKDRLMANQCFNYTNMMDPCLIQLCQCGFCMEGLVAERIAEFTDNRFQSNAHLFTYEQIVKMTHNFETVIGRGGFGIVYYGLLEDGTDVAIKLQRHSSQQSDMEFFAELRSLTQVHHTNLISLIGYCKDRSYLAIVYEYMPQGNLQDHLRGEAGFPVLTWVQRLQIAYQAAQGLDYLHTRCNPPIVHRDVKSSNILLGADLEAKITDFGISKAWNENDTYTTTRVVGTVGYIDPAYFRTGYASDASDVYSFGIILLEMITGQPPIIRGPEVQQHIVQWISLRVTGEGDFVDTSMNEYYDPSSVWNVLQLALSCTDLSASRRPRMAEVVIQLKEIIEMKPLKQMTEDMNDKDMENEQVEEAFVTSIAQADRPICMHKLSANLFTSWTHNTPGRRFWRCKNWKMAGDCGFFKWHDPVQESVAIEQLDFVIHQSEELDEEIMILDEESAILFCKLKVLQEKLVECKRSKKALEMKLESMDRFYVHMTFLMIRLLISKNGAEVDEHGMPEAIGETINVNEAAPTEGVTQKKKTWASLFKNNWKPTSGVSLEQYEAKGERLSFDFDDIDDIEDTMGFCLVGCFMDKHPRRNEVYAIANQWRVPYKFFMHKSECVVYCFDTKEDRDGVLQGGPYFAFGVPIFLKLMPKYFLFHEDGQLVPAWIQIHGLPPYCWSQKVLSMIGLEIGKPLYTDNLTRSRERLEFARLLVEVPIIGDRIYEEDCRGASQLNLNAPHEGRPRSKSTGNWGRRRSQPRYRTQARQTNQQPQNVEEPATQNGLTIVVVHSPKPVTIEPPLDHEEVGAQHVHHVEVLNAEEELSAIPEVSSSKEASSSSADHQSQRLVVMQIDPRQNHLRLYQ